MVYKTNELEKELDAFTYAIGLYKERRFGYTGETVPTATMNGGSTTGAGAG